LLYFDESGFSPNPSLQYGWGRIGETRSVGPLAHRQRVNVLGALRRDGQSIWTAQQRTTRRDNVIAFFDQIADQPHSVPRIVLLDNAAIHKGEAMEKKRRRWARQGLHLYYLPPYSPKLNRIEIVWKHAKYFWRRFVAMNGAALLDEIRSLMKGFWTEVTANYFLTTWELKMALNRRHEIDVVLDPVAARNEGPAGPGALARCRAAFSAMPPPPGLVDLTDAMVAILGIHLYLRI
jgi:transposase